MEEQCCLHNQEIGLKSIYLHTEVVHNMEAPREVVPIVLKMLEVNSVLDVGCGTGTWLKAFEENGIEEYTGIDGEHLIMKHLQIPPSHFIAIDLNSSWSLKRKFDLVISLEVAEHLPESQADEFVARLVEHGDTILFSAAVPGQGGQNHINEQWPAYWRNKFLKHGYYFHDIIRPLIWNNDKVEWWYKQNMFLITKEKIDLIADLSRIHPDFFALTISNQKEYISSLKNGQQGMKLAMKIFWNSFIYKIRNLWS